MGLSKQQILQIAEQREFCVHAYRWSQTKLRQKCRRMAKDGLLVLIERRNNEFIYRRADPTRSP